MAVSSDISSLKKAYEPYAAHASISDGVIDSSTSTVTGDRTNGLFSTSSKEMGKDDFLLLLVTQLRYQDPLNPMENTEFVSQLAQFRAMESSSNIESAIKNLDESFKGSVDAQSYAARSITNTSAVSLIGKEVRIRQTTVEWIAKAGESVSMQIHLGNSSNAVVEIQDRDGNVVKTLQTEGKDSANSVILKWDGTTDTGKIAMSGTYKIHIVDEESDPSLYAYVQDVVNGVRFTSDGAMVKVAGKELSIGKILDVATGNGGPDGMSLSSSSAVSLIGKHVRVKDDTVTFKEGTEAVSIQIETGGRDSVQVDIVDNSGVIVTTLNCTDVVDGIATLFWNGSVSDGGYAPTGEYTVKIRGQETNPYMYSFSEGRVDGITGIGGVSRLRVNGTVVSISDIIDIGNGAVLTDGVIT